MSSRHLKLHARRARDLRLDLPVEHEPVDRSKGDHQIFDKQSIVRGFNGRRAYLFLRAY